MKDTVTMLVEALEDCIEDSKQVLSEMIQTYGSKYEKERIAAQRETIAKAEAALSAAKGGGWLPIESAPKDGSEFVAAYGNQGFVKELVRWDAFHKIWKSKGAWVPGFEQNATHWQPLPPPPKN